MNTMKTKFNLSLWLLTIGLLAIAAPGAAQTVGLNGKLSSAEPKTNAFVWVTLVTGTNVAATATNPTMFSAATFYGYKSATNNAAPTANTASAYIGYKDTAGTITTANTPAVFDTITAGSYLGLRTIGVKYNLSQFYFVGTTGDKVLIVYEQ